MQIEINRDEMTEQTYDYSLSCLFNFSKSTSCGLWKYGSTCFWVLVIVIYCYELRENLVTWVVLFCALCPFGRFIYSGISLHILILLADVLYRSDFFPGLGWMLSRSTWDELSPKWPKAYPSRIAFVYSFLNIIKYFFKT